MHSSGSLLFTTLNRIRSFLDEPTLDAKFSNDYLIRHVITPEIANVMSMIIEARKSPIVVRHLISLTTSGEYYELPPSIGKVYRLAKVDANKNITNEIPLRSPDHSEDAGWWVEGRELHVRPLPGESNTDYFIWFTPSGNIVPHYSASGGTINWTARDTLTIDTTPDLGDFDHRPDAYIGCVVRAWINDTGEPDKVDERIITSYAIGASSVTAGVRTAFSAGTWSAEQPNVKYEIVPYFMDQIWQAVAISSAINLGASRNISEKQMSFLQGQLQTAIRAASATFDPASNETIHRPETSVLHNVISKIRWKLSPTLQESLSDDYLVNVSVIPELQKILTVANKDYDTSIIVTQDITTVASQNHYLLNPNISKVVRVAKKDATTGLPYREVRKRNEKDPLGHGWSLEGNRLSLSPAPDTAETVKVWYVPNGAVAPHYAIDGYLNDTTSMKLTKGNLFSGLLGEVDRRSSSYVGSVVRLTTSTGTIEERVITAHNAADDSGYQGSITVTEPFTGDVARDCTYEIIPSWWANLESSVVDGSVLSLSSRDKELGEGGYAALNQTYQSSLGAMKTDLATRNEERFTTPKRYSMLHSILEKIQVTLEKLVPGLNHSSDFIMRQGVNNELNNVISRINNTRSNPYYCTFSLTTVKDQQYYSLPSGIGEIARIVELDDSGRITKDLLPKSNYGWSGPGWSIENNMISFRPYPSSEDTYTVWYIPNGASWPHYAEDGSLDATRSIFTLTNSDWGSQVLGDVDKREGAYVGYILRILGSSSNFGTEFGSEVVEERTIKSHDPEAGTVTVERAFSSNIDTGTCKYEVVPIYLHAVNEAVAAGTIVNLSTGSSAMTERQQKTLYINYRSAMKTAGDNLSNIQARVPKHFQKNTVDNEGNWDLVG